MKKGCRRLLIFEIIMLIIILINSVFTPFLSEIGLCIFLLIALVIFKKIFGFEKTRYNYTKDIIIEITIFVTSFFIIYYILGLYIGFTNSMSVYTVVEKLKIVLLLSLTIILKEYLRYMILCKGELNKTITISSIILFIFLDIQTSIAPGNFTDSYSIFKFIAMVIMPAISANIAYSYVSKKVGYIPVIYYSIIMSIYQYIIPIIPNVNNYIYSLILLLLPYLLTQVVFKTLKNSNDEEEKERNYYKNKHVYLGYIPVIAIIMIMIYFYSGYFRFWVITIATGSMKPNIQIGDLVLIDKNVNKNKLEKGQIIAYKNNNSIIVHRIDDKITSNKETFYITKGDANEQPDALIVSTDMILGSIEKKIPYVGLPTVWLHDMLS